MIVLGHDDLIGQWIYSRIGGEWVPRSGRCLGYFDGRAITAGIAFTQFNGRNMFADLAIDGRRFPPSLLRAGFAYAFNQLQCTRLTLTTESSNLDSVKLIRRLGAVHEATLSGAARDGEDILMFRLTPECTIWKKLNGQERRLSRRT